MITYLNIEIEEEDFDNTPNLKNFLKETKEQRQEWGKKVSNKEFDRQADRLFFSFKGEFADIAVFADNVVSIIKHRELKYVISVWFSTEPLHGDNIQLFYKDQIGIVL